MDLNVKPVVLFIGNYGSGKTEVSINFAVNRVAAGIVVQIADLDVVNPYFRSRDVRDILVAKGIEVVVPEQMLINADLPVIVAGVRGIIEQPKGIAILDVGGDNVGATVLGSLNNSLKDHAYDMLQVVNLNRPFTETVKDTVEITREIEVSSRLKVTGVVGNSHLMDHTDIETIRKGYHHTRAVAEALDVEVKFITCAQHLLAEIEPGEFDCPVLPLERQLMPPWRRRVKIGSQNFVLS